MIKIMIENITVRLQRRYRYRYRKKELLLSKKVIIMAL